MRRSREDWFLNRAEEATWSSLVGTLLLLPAVLDAQLRRDAGTSLYEFGVIATLAVQEGRTLPIKRLARFTGGSVSRLSHMITRLEERGWLERIAGPDGRTTQAKLTKRGHDKLMDTAPDHVLELRRLVFDRLTPMERRVLARVSWKINQGITTPPGS